MGAGKRRRLWVAWAVLAVAGCGGFEIPVSAPLFTVPLSVEGRPVSPAILDTGGGYELLLRENFGLPIAGQAEVLAFGGREIVELTGGFRYDAGGVEETAQFALIGVSVCDCNGLGYHFFQKTGVVLGLDFRSRKAHFLPTVPLGGVTIPFVSAAETLDGFETSFIEVEIGAGFDPPAPGTGVILEALLDTGSNITVVRRGLLDGGQSEDAKRQDITITHPKLGTLGASVVLFDTPGLPAVILGTDSMGAWGDRWYFSFARKGGAVTVNINDTLLDTAGESR